jgi:ornithine--oxo-acid transaminase
MEMGNLFRSNLERLKEKSKLINLIRGKGLLNALVINDSETSSTAWNICLKMRDNGLIAKPTHGNIIRFAPPLVINKDQVEESCKIIEKSIAEFE